MILESCWDVWSEPEQCCSRNQSRVSTPVPDLTSSFHETLDLVILTRGQKWAFGVASRSVILAEQSNSEGDYRRASFQANVGFESCILLCAFCYI